MSRAERRQRVRDVLPGLGADALVATTAVNIRYLTGFTGSNGAALIGESGRAVLLTDGRYRDQAAAECDVEVVVCRDLLAEAAHRAGAGILAVETHTLSVDEHDRLTEALNGTAPVSAQRVVEGLREVKDAEEVEALRQACAISVEALEAELAGPLVGRTERQVARSLEARMFDLGAEAIAFETICASGPNSAVPHHRPTDRVLARGDLLKIDFGARVRGYHADLTRTVSLGPAADWQREIHAAVRQAQALGVSMLTAGTEVAAVDAAVRADLETSGWLESFTTGLGHGVGLEIHEDPFFSPHRRSRLAVRTVLTMEPGIYRPSLGGVRIEDTVCVGPGEPEILTQTSTDLQEIG